MLNIHRIFLEREHHQQQEFAVQWQTGAVRSFWMFATFAGRDSIVSVAVHYGLDSPWVKSQWGHDFLCPSRPVQRSTQCTMGTGPSLGVKQLGRGADHLPRACIGM